MLKKISFTLGQIMRLLLPPFCCLDFNQLTRLTMCTTIKAVNPANFQKKCLNKSSGNFSRSQSEEASRLSARQVQHYYCLRNSSGAPHKKTVSKLLHKHSNFLEAEVYLRLEEWLQYVSDVCAMCSVR